MLCVQKWSIRMVGRLTSGIECNYVFFPHVHTMQMVALDILQNRWSPTYDISSILTSIQVT